MRTSADNNDRSRECHPKTGKNRYCFSLYKIHASHNKELLVLLAMRKA